MKKHVFAYCIFNTRTREIHTVLTEKEYLDFDRVIDYNGDESIAIAKSIARLHFLDLHFETNALYNKFMDIVGM